MYKPVFVLAPDSFKGSMTALEVCDAMEYGIKKILPGSECIKVPMADGGEGTMQSLVDATHGKIYKQTVTGPLGDPVNAEFGILGDGKTGIIEMASASGLGLIADKMLNPLVTTTYGTGQLFKACLDKNIKRVVIGIGGSATNDGGAGFAQALGIRLLDKNGNNLPYGGEALKHLESIDITHVDSRIKDIEIVIASDVTNPLCGEKGASHVFGPQKGATPDMVQILDNSLSHYAEIIKHQLGKDIKDTAGAGAAGGLGAGLLAFTDARMASGVETVIHYTGLKEKIKNADFIFTGEGSIDKQTLFGKTPFGVAQLAKNDGKMVVALAGNIGQDIEHLYDYGFSAVFGILPSVMNLEEALISGKENVARTVENIVRLLIYKNS